MLIAQFSSVDYTIMMFFRHIVIHFTQLILHIYVYLFIYVDSKILPPESYPEAVICPESN